MKIAWFTPFGVRSAIGTYSQTIVETLALADDVTLFVAREDLSGSEVRRTNVPTFGFDASTIAEAVERARQHDVVVYNMGDNLQFHLLPFLVKAQIPGITILHDIVMRDFYRGYVEFHLKNPRLFPRFQHAAHGTAGDDLWAEEVAGRFDDCPEDVRRLGLPMFERSLDRSTGVVVHSKYARKRVADAVAVPVRHIDFPASPGWANERPTDRPDSDRVELLTYGVLGKNKQIHEVIRAIGRNETLRESVRYTLIGSGEAAYERHLHRTIAQFDLAKTVLLRGWQPDEVLNEAIAGADIVINLRNPHCGESSWSLLNSLLAGAPTVVWNHGYYAEFPDDVVCKVSSKRELRDCLVRLIADPGERKAIGLRAQAHARGRFTTTGYCEKLREFIEVVRNQEAVWTFTDRVAGYLAELGVSADFDPITARVSAEIAAFVGDRDALSASTSGNRSRT